MTRLVDARAAADGYSRAYFHHLFKGGRVFWGRCCSAGTNRPSSKARMAEIPSVIQEDGFAALRSRLSTAWRWDKVVAKAETGGYGSEGLRRVALRTAMSFICTGESVKNRGGQAAGILVAEAISL